jgi:uncharacterized protein
VAIDELTRPLGQTKRPASATSDWGMRLFAGVLIGFALASLAFLLLPTHRSSREAVLIRATIPPSPEPRAAPPRPAQPAPAPAQNQDPPAAANVITIIDGLTGKRQDVVLTPSAKTGAPQSVQENAQTTEGVGRGRKR